MAALLQFFAMRTPVFLQDNNAYIVSGAGDGTMRKWDCETGLLVRELWQGQGAGIHALTPSSNVKMIGCARRGDGSVQQRPWEKNGDSAWSPRGLASRSYDEIRQTDSGEVEVDPIKGNQQGVYTGLGDKIAPGESNMICIWNSNTGDLLVGQMQGLVVRSAV